MAETTKRGRGRPPKSQKATSQSSPYQTLEDIPIHVFSNRMCTETPNEELKKYLRWMLNNCPDDLDYIWSYTQRWKDYGGTYFMTFNNWLKKLDTDLKKQGYD